MRRIHNPSVKGDDLRAVSLVKNKEADAVVSAGNTGALMAMARFNLKMMEGIERPAIAALWPTVRGESIVLDVGASIGADEAHLVNLAAMGSAMARVLFSLERPSVGLLNIGVEEVKGLEEVREANALLRAAPSDHFGYHGFVEGDDIGKGTVDVVVTEGFSGNIALKTAEGTARLVASYLRQALKRSLFSKIGAVIASGALNALKRKMDPRAQNGGVFLGLNGIVVKSHGSADAVGFASALDIAAASFGGVLRSTTREIPSETLLLDQTVDAVISMLDVEIDSDVRAALRAGTTTVVEASTLYAQALAYQPYEQARTLLDRYDQRPNLEQAVTLLNAALTKDPRYALAHAGLGEVYLRLWMLAKDSEFARLAEDHCEVDGRDPRRIRLAHGLIDRHRRDDGVHDHRRDGARAFIGGCVAHPSAQVVGSVGQRRCRRERARSADQCRREVAQFAAGEVAVVVEVHVQVRRRAIRHPRASQVVDGIHIDRRQGVVRDRGRDACGRGVGAFSSRCGSGKAECGARM